MFLIIDNYDSFVYTLARYVGLCGFERKVIRNDAVSLQDIQSLNPTGIIISPGPCAPKDAGLSNQIIREFSGKTPVFGVCLGHQCIGEVFGGCIERSAPVHGRTSKILHDGSGVLAGLPQNFPATRYHSLIVEEIENSDLIKTAWLADGTLMGLRHKSHPTYGVQFHPEAVLTQNGLQIIRNFIDLSLTFHKERKNVA